MAKTDKPREEFSCSFLFSLSSRGCAAPPIRWAVLLYTVYSGGPFFSFLSLGFFSKRSGGTEIWGMLSGSLFVGSQSCTHYTLHTTAINQVEATTNFSSPSVAGSFCLSLIFQRRPKSLFQRHSEREAQGARSQLKTDFHKEVQTLKMESTRPFFLLRTTNYR